jgi:hypothetical protein
MPTEYTGLASIDGTRVLHDDGSHCIKCGKLWPPDTKHDCPVDKENRDKEKARKSLAEATAKIRDGHALNHAPTTVLGYCAENDGISATYCETGILLVALGLFEVVPKE